MPALSLPLGNVTKQHTLQHIFPATNVSLPIQIQLTDSQLSIKESIVFEQLNTVELIVFSDLHLEHFLALLSVIQYNACFLTAINCRAKKTSYRFSLELDSVEALLHYKTQINDYALTHQFEAALISNAPHLSTPGLLVMDMDSTTIEIECIDEIAALAGVGKEVSEVTELAMQGKLDFSQSLRARVGKLSGAPETILAQVGDNLPHMDGLTTLVETLHKNNWKVAVASGGFTYFTEILKEQLNLDATQANVLEIVDGKLTGQVIGDITDAQVKADTLIRLADEFNTAEQQTVAMGDGANDLTMMSAAHLGVAYKAKPIVLQKAASSINFSGLDCLLHWLK